MDRPGPPKDQHGTPNLPRPRCRPSPSSASPRRPSSETLPNSRPKGLRLKAHRRAALRVKETRTPFCLHNRTIKFQRRLADSLSIKFSFCKHFVALFCAKLITSTLWVSSLKQERHSVNGDNHGHAARCGHRLQTAARVLGQGRTCREARGMTASRPAPACAAAASARTGEGQRAAQGQAPLLPVRSAPRGLRCPTTGTATSAEGLSHFWAVKSVLPTKL